MTVSELVTHKDEINRIRGVALALGQLPGARFGDDAGPVSHDFADGLYIRTYTGIKGSIAVSKLHKTNHPYFVMRGDVSVYDGGREVARIKAPYHGITRAGTQRILYFHEETIWITVHATEETDLEKIEDMVIAKSYDELPEYVKSEVQIWHGH
jgi:hypothetical protein